MEHVLMTSDNAELIASLRYQAAARMGQFRLLMEKAADAIEGLRADLIERDARIAKALATSSHDIACRSLDTAPGACNCWRSILYGTLRTAVLGVTIP